MAPSTETVRLALGLQFPLVHVAFVSLVGFANAAIEAVALNVHFGVHVLDLVARGLILLTLASDTRVLFLVADIDFLLAGIEVVFAFLAANAECLVARLEVVVAILPAADFLVFAIFDSGNFLLAFQQGSSSQW